MHELASPHFVLGLAVSMLEQQATARPVSLALFRINTFGGLFSYYLTFLERFLIRETCAWCLSSQFTIMALIYFSAIS